MLVDQHVPRTHLCVHVTCALQMPKRGQQSETQLAAAKRARDLPRRGGSGMPQPMQHQPPIHRQRRSPGAAAPPSPPRPSHQRTTCCQSLHLRQRRRQLRTARPQQSHDPGRSARHPPLPTYVSSSLPVHATASARMRRCARPCHRLRCGAACRSQRPRPSRSGRGHCPCLTCALCPHPGLACTCTPPHRMAHALSIDSSEYWCDSEPPRALWSSRGVYAGLLYPKV